MDPVIGVQSASEGVCEPAWEIARLFPAQGSWSEEEYLCLKGNRLIEFSHGFVEVLTMPTTTHQLIVDFLVELLKAFVRPRGLGLPLFAPIRVRLWPGKFREPDVVFMLAANRDRVREEFWEGADLVMEVVSDDDRRRDLETKRREYAQAGIPEYWIVDPQQSLVTVLTLDRDHYAGHGQFAPGAAANSLLLPGFTVEVADVFAAGARRE
jgi:Uma2 family endonuclease